MTKTPPEWDPQAVRVAVAQIQGLVEGLFADYSGDAYRAELDKVIAEAIEPYEDDADFDQMSYRIALLIYGATIVAGVSSGIAAEGLKMTPEQTRGIVGQAVNAWLDNPTAGQ